MYKLVAWLGGNRGRGNGGLGMVLAAPAPPTRDFWLRKMMIFMTKVGRYSPTSYLEKVHKLIAELQHYLYFIFNA